MSFQRNGFGDNQQRAPYPDTELAWDPVESLEEFNKSTYSSYIQHLDSVPLDTAPPIPGPPLPTRPPQHIIDQHISSINQKEQFQSFQRTPFINTNTAPNSTSLQSTPSTSRVRGPRQLPNKFSNPNLSASINSSPGYGVRQEWPQINYNPGGFNTPPRPDPFNSSPQRSMPNSSPFMNQNESSFMSSPIQIQPLNSSPVQQIHQSPITGPRPFPFSSPSYNQQPPSPTSQRRLPLKVNTISNQYSIQNDTSFMDSPTSAYTQKLPDIPTLTPSTMQESPVQFNTDQQRTSRNSPSPTKGLAGPRLMPSMSSHSTLKISPSSSPTKVDYYDHRTSWNSAYSLNIIPADENDDLDSISAPPSAVEIVPEVPNVSTIPPIPRTTSLFDPDSIPIPDEPPQRGSTITSRQTGGEKGLPPLPDSLNLPSLPFSSYSLMASHFKECENIQLLSELFKWSVSLVNEWSEGLNISKNEYKRSLKLMISNNSPKLNNFIIDANIETILNSFEKQNAIYFDHNDNVHFMDNVNVSGVLPQLTGCYSKAHNISSLYQCYSPRCSLTIYQPPVPTVPAKESGVAKLGEWTSYWNITEQDLVEMDESEVKKQSHIFELIRQQQNIINLGEIQIREYGQSFKNANPQLLPDVSKFYNDAFNSVKPLIDIHKKHLLEPLLHRINTQGKFITNIGELFLNWATAATVPYLKYTEKLATVRELIKFEKNRQSRFAEWLYKVDQNPKVMEASLDHNRIFFSGFIGHTQLLSLALNSVYKKTRENDMDHVLLKNAIDEINKLNRKIDEMQDSALQNRHLRLLAGRLTWKNNVLANDLKLSEPNRRLIKEGAVTRKREKWITSNYYLILLDNYLLITEPQKDEHYKISEKPIPIEFLQIETKNFASASNVNLSTEGEIYPFKVRYTGQNVSYTFYAETLAERDSWFHSINQVQSKKVKNSIFEPFKISILADQFAYEEGEQPQKLPLLAAGSNIDVALKSIEADKSTDVTRPLMFSEVSCGTTFHFQDRSFYVLGLNFGLYITEAENPKGWKRVLELGKITQVEQLDSLMVILADKALYYFNIVSLLLNYYDQNYDGQTVGEKLSKRDVSFFKIGTYYNTKLLFLMKSSISTVGSRFKVYTPIMDTFGVFQYFQLYKRFQYASDCFGISIFNSMFVLHTSKGFEILSFQILNESQPIPKFIEYLKKPKTELDLIKKKLNSSSAKPLTMVKVFQKPQFYLIYDSFAIVIDTIGQLISNNFIFPFKFKCSKVCLKENFLICIGEDIVEIFDLNYDDALGFQKFDPVQIITGKDIRLIDGIDAKIVMAHPKITGRQLVITLDRIL
ncbi:hypothetical protein WICANDRAFT_76879 [Wickerhamomyces anomalus NRRL Y-366-8]|uniref:PH domain-containing protein n=1 Tax=Wickerhamomyces anomalus (strain ATCC 58044 / CBS 1984 / NCYC 433 / NRRL Y-366-8) TaxID=683960 RepID=A0A1E3PBN2_WICAA|nr:uncharacterized protein WICANDRAFT_76879 [Wickerhamomyces anomalus NRRL Y-366-8]ODQ62710.1 hypothetical protein WICANDRAFT_76879 [Wickerhamomyces anomalus NRRL Y-366-8]